MMLITPAIASAPYSAEPGPFTISTCSMSSAGKRDRSIVPLTRPVARCPSTRISVYFGSSPCICTPAPPAPANARSTCRPGCSSSSSARFSAPLASIASRRITCVATALSPTACSVRAPVTTIVRDSSAKPMSAGTGGGRRGVGVASSSMMARRGTERDAGAAS